MIEDEPRTQFADFLQSILRIDRDEASGLSMYVGVL